MFFTNNNTVNPEPGVIVGPIANVFGFILDAIYNVFYAISSSLALGLSIIFFTFIVRLLILPLGIKQQKHAISMRKLQPDIQKINKKYEGRNEMSDKQAKTAEIQKLYADKKVNPFAGCLPALIQWPIFITLFSMFRSPYAYITRLRDAYLSIINQMVTYENWAEPINRTLSLGYNRVTLPFNMNEPNDLTRLIFTYSIEDWQTYFAQIPSQFVPALESLINSVRGMETFLGIDMVSAVFFNWPAVLLPILAAASSFLTSRVMMKSSPVDKDAPGAALQKPMMYMMPVMMGFITFVSPGALGVYWIASNLFHLIQIVVLEKKYAPKEGIS